MEQKFLVNEQNRRNHMNGVIHKQREREKRAKKVREKLTMDLEGSVVQIDEFYNSGYSSDGTLSYKSVSFLLHQRCPLIGKRIL